MIESYVSDTRVLTDYKLRHTLSTRANTRVHSGIVDVRARIRRGADFIREPFRYDSLLRIADPATVSIYIRKGTHCIC